MTNQVLWWSGFMIIVGMLGVAIWGWMQTPELFTYMHHVFCM